MSTACWLPEMCTDEYTFLAARCHSYGLYKLTGQNASLTSSISQLRLGQVTTYSAAMHEKSFLYITGNQTYHHEVQSTHL